MSETEHGGHRRATEGHVKAQQLGSEESRGTDGTLKVNTWPDNRHATTTASGPR